MNSINTLTECDTQLDMDTFVRAIPWNQKNSSVALIDDDRQLTYGQLAEESQKIAKFVYDRSGTGNYIVVPATSDATFIAKLLGVMVSGNSPIPISNELPEQDLKYILEKFGAKEAVSDLDSEAIVALPKPSDWIDHSDKPSSAMVMCTSGTSGYPKGVMLTHANILHACRTIADYLDYHQFNSAAVILPLHYSYALLSQVLAQLLIGGRCQLFSDFRNPIEVGKTITEAELETICGVPSTFLAMSLIHKMVPLAMPSIRVVCSAGAAMDRSRFETVKQIMPNSTFFNNYGMTEAAPRIAYIREDDPRFLEPTCGKAMAGVSVKIVDAETHESVQDGNPGMLVVKGANITSGYLNDEETTSKAFTNDGYLISGDIAHIDHDYIYISGRHDDIFNVAGEKVAPLEIERALDTLAEIEKSAVVGVVDEQRGKIPVAFVKLNNKDVRRKDIVRSLKRILVPVKIPSRFFEVESFPMTSNGKLQRRRLSPEDRQFVVREIS